MGVVGVVVNGWIFARMVPGQDAARVDDKRRAYSAFHRDKKWGFSNLERGGKQNGCDGGREGNRARKRGLRAQETTAWSCVVSTWLNFSGFLCRTSQVNRQLLATDVYGEDAIMLSIRSGNDIMFFTVIRHLKEEQVVGYKL